MNSHIYDVDFKRLLKSSKYMYLFYSFYFNYSCTFFLFDINLVCFCRTCHFRTWKGVLTFFCFLCWIDTTVFSNQFLSQTLLFFSYIYIYIYIYILVQTCNRTSLDITYTKSCNWTLVNFLNLIYHIIQKQLISSWSREIVRITNHHHCYMWPMKTLVVDLA